MDFKKCERCGCFFASNDNVCFNCLTKDRFEMSKFKTFIEENDVHQINSLNDISYQTGISQKNLNRLGKNAIKTASNYTMDKIKDNWINIIEKK